MNLPRLLENDCLTNVTLSKASSTGQNPKKKDFYKGN